MIYVAMGDSFSAGTPGSAGVAWPDLLADRLRRGGERDVAFHNLAVPGAGSADLMEQLPVAAEMAPDLVTVVFGANDILLRTRPDPGAYEERLRLVLTELRRGAPDRLIVTATSPEKWAFLPLRPRTRLRVEGGLAAVNEATRRVGAEAGIPVLDVAIYDGLGEQENFDVDGLHPSPLGHARAAAAFAALVEHHLTQTTLEVAP